ncbi:EAL domain-containing protein (plasmid) [Enterobacter ludwigii]
MYPKSSKSLNLARMLTALLTVLCIITVGTLATGYQVRESERREAAMAAQRAIIQIDLLLDEAGHGAVQARPFLAQHCSPNVRNELNRLAIKWPHLRVISLLQEEQLTCSSFDTPMLQKVDISHYAGQRLSLRQGSTITPNSPYIVLLSRFPEGTVSVSIALHHVTEILSLLSTHTSLSMRVDNQVLSSQGKLMPVTHLTSELYVRSDRYPYTVGYVRPSIPPLWTLPKRSNILFSLFIILSGVGGGLVWVLSFKPPSPYDQLAQAVKRQDIIPWYQPVVSSLTGKIQGVEVLARWKHRSGVFIPPDVFIPQAEKSGLIIPITRQLMSRAAADLAPVISRLYQPFHIAFNISAAHILAGKLTVDDFRHFLTLFPEGSIQLVAEITEREPFTKYPGLNELLHSFHRLGVQIALDDFGTGYSNLGYLNILPVDYIKVDHSFISRLTEGEPTDRLVECVISMAKTLNLTLVAEGVETRYQAEWLTAHQVAFLQGYYFSRPLPASGFIRLAVLQGKLYESPQV